jgi:hypothetical protein
MNEIRLNPKKFSPLCLKEDCEMNEQNIFSQSQKLMISRIVIALKCSSKLNTTQIHDTLFNLSLPTYSLKSLYSCLKELQMCRIVTCEIVRKEDDEPKTITDYFSLTENSDRLLKQLQISEVSYDRKRKKLGEEYVILNCSQCHSYRIAHFPFKIVKCFNCCKAFSESNIIARARTREEAISLLKDFKSSKIL